MCFVSTALFVMACIFRSGQTASAADRFMPPCANLGRTPLKIIPVLSAYGYADGESVFFDWLASAIDMTDYTAKHVNGDDLPRLWDAGRAATADGTHVTLRENNLIGAQHIRYGGYGGIAYHATEIVNVIRGRQLFRGGQDRSVPS